MGKLAMWGAVAGAGKGMQVNAENKLKAEQAELDQMREEAILRMKEKWATEREERGYSQQEYMLGKETDAKKGILGAEQGFRTSEREATQKFEAGESAKDRASREAIAKEETEAKKITSGRDMYKSVMVKTASVDPETGAIEEKNIPLTFEPDTGRYYEDKGGKLIPFDLRANLNPIEQQLFDNPEAVNQFQQTPYGKKHGVPKWFETIHGGP